MGTFSRSIGLVKASWAVLRQDKELMLLPVMSSIVSLVLVAPFFGAAFLTVDMSATTSSTSTTATTGPGATMSILGWVLLFIAYLLGTYVVIFFQSALVLAANDRMTGGTPTLGSALSMAWENAGRILPWAVISATVSVVLQAIQQRAGFIGRIVIGLVGLAWTLVTLLVLPVIVLEHVGVKEALQRSAGAFKRTWGENVVGNGGIGIIGVIGMFIGLLVCGPIVFVGVSAENIPLVVAGVALFVVWMVLVSVFTSAMNGVFRTALYRYAMLGEEPAGFTHDQIAGAFKPKHSRFGGGAA